MIYPLESAIGRLSNRGLVMKRTTVKFSSLPPYGTEHRSERGFNLSVALQTTHLAQERLATPLGSTSPTLFEQRCGFFYVPQEPDNCETGPTDFCPYLRRLESLTVSRCRWKGSTFWLVIFKKTSRVGPARRRFSRNGTILQTRNVKNLFGGS